jgi:hypothetical protein
MQLLYPVVLVGFNDLEQLSAVSALNSALHGIGNFVDAVAVPDAVLERFGQAGSDRCLPVPEPVGQLQAVRPAFGEGFVGQSGNGRALQAARAGSNSRDRNRRMPLAND